MNYWTIEDSNIYSIWQPRRLFPIILLVLISLSPFNLVNSSFAQDSGLYPDNDADYYWGYYSEDSRRNNDEGWSSKGQEIVHILNTNAFTVRGDQTHRFLPQRRVQVAGKRTGTIYGTISSRGFAYPDTTVNVTWDSHAPYKEVLVVYLSNYVPDTAHIPPARQYPADNDDEYYYNYRNAERDNPPLPPRRSPPSYYYDPYYKWYEYYDYGDSYTYPRDNDSEYYYEPERDNDNELTDEDQWILFGGGG